MRTSGTEPKVKYYSEFFASSPEEGKKTLEDLIQSLLYKKRIHFRKNKFQYTFFIRTMLLNSYFCILSKYTVEKNQDECIYMHALAANCEKSSIRH